MPSGAKIVATLALGLTGAQGLKSRGTAAAQSQWDMTQFLVETYDKHQKEIKGEVKEATTEDLFKETEKVNCQCLNWKNTYESNLVQCGRGLEYLHTMSMPKTWWNGPYNAGNPDQWVSAMKQEWSKVDFFEKNFPTCKLLYEKMNNNMCMKAAFEEGVMLPPKGEDKPKWWTNRWCYVSEACKSPVVRIGNASIKFCDREQGDQFLADLSPIQLRDNVATPLKLPFIFLAEAAYPTHSLEDLKNDTKEAAKTAAILSYPTPVLVGKGGSKFLKTSAADGSNWYKVTGDPHDKNAEDVVLSEIPSVEISPDWD